MKRRWSSIVLVLAFGMLPDLAVAQLKTQWQLGAPGRGWPLDGVGGGPNVDFVQEANVNPPPGNPMSPAVAQQADDDYYFAGTFPDPPAGVGMVANDEIAMERAFAGIDNDLRIHFNLPADMDPKSQFRFSFEANNLDERAENPDPRYGVEVRFNGVLIMPERIIRPADLNKVFNTGLTGQTLEDVGAALGARGDNVIALRGINYNAEGGGNWMGMDYHKLEVGIPPDPPEVPMLDEWAMIAFTALLLIVGVFCIRRRPRFATE